MSYAQLGRDVEAAAAATKVLDLVPDFSAETHAENDAFRDPGVIEHFLESARKAGLPACATEQQMAKYPGVKRIEKCEAARIRNNKSTLLY